MLGTTAYDGAVELDLRGFDCVADRAARPTLRRDPRPGRRSSLVVGGAVRGAAPSRSPGRLGGARAGCPAQFAHSLVPIALGYVVAHYYSLLVLVGQQTAIQQLADPLGTGANWLGPGDRARRPSPGPADLRREPCR